MKLKHRIILQILIFTTMIGLLFVTTKSSIILSNFTNFESQILSDIEQTERNQARMQLENIRNIAIQDIQNGQLNVNDKYSMQLWAKKNVSCLLNGGPTGDAFMIELGTEQFIWDGSPDCSKTEFIKNGRYMKDEIEMHKNKEQADKMLNLMILWIDTKLGDNYWWQFDDAVEWLEWIVIPIDKYGFNGEASTIGGLKNTEYKKLIIVLGTQSDEATYSYKESVKSVHTIKMDLYVTLGGAIIFNILFIFYMMNNLIKRSE